MKAINTYMTVGMLLITVVTCVEITDIKSIMRSYGVVPDVIDSAPSKLMKIVYPNGKKVSLGNELTPAEVVDEPSVMWDADENALYTLLMCDPDAPTPENPSNREIRHWLVHNIRGCNVDKGQVVFGYRGSNPPRKESGIHRYIFLVFKQNAKIETSVFVPRTSRDHRQRTKVRDLIKENNLCDPPIAGNFFLSQFVE